MAIPFLNNLNLNNSEIQNVKLHNTGSIPSPSSGHIYYDTSLDVAQYYGDATDQWIKLTDTSLSGSTFVNATLSGTEAKKIYTVSLSAAGTPDASKFLRGDNTWATVVQENDFLTALSFNDTNGILTASVQNQADVTVDLDGRYALIGQIPVVNNGILTVNGIGVLGGTGSFTANQAGNTVINISHDNVTRTDTASTDNPGYGQTFQAVTSVTTSAEGHVTGIDVSTVTIPASDNTDVNVTTANLKTRLGELTGETTITGTKIIIPGNLEVIGTTTTNNVETVSTSNGVIFEGNAADDNEVTLLAQTVTADRTIVLPDASGTVALTSDVIKRYSGLIGGSTSIDITAATHGMGADSSAFLIQTVDASTGETVFCDVTRGASGLVTFDFATPPAAGSIRVLMINVG